MERKQLQQQHMDSDISSVNAKTNGTDYLLKYMTHPLAAATYNSNIFSRLSQCFIIYLSLSLLSDLLRHNQEVCVAVYLLMEN